MKTTTNARRMRPSTIALFFAVAATVATSQQPVAQSFISGSDGSDGELDVAASQGTVVFDPADAARWGRVLDADGDGVYHFTTITIGAGTTLQLRGDKVSGPVHWLATGNVVVNGVLNLNGEGSSLVHELHQRRILAVPGAGGYAGGAGGGPSPVVPATPGEGPGGGSGVVVGCTGCGAGGVFTGNRYLIPLIGGSGGAGGTWTGVFPCGGNVNCYARGGAGGGAILIASSTSIAVSGSITATGGTAQGLTGNFTISGGGSGGAIRLVAPSLTGNGQLAVTQGNGNGSGPGWVRLEGFSISNGFQFPAGTGFVARGSPVDAATMIPSGSVRVVAVAGMPVPIHPSGSFALPDVAINAGGPVNVDIEARGIPPGTVVTLRVMVETPADLTELYMPDVQATLQGSTQLSTATVQFAFPYGFSRGHVRARWTQ